MKIYSISDFGATVCDRPQTKEIQSAIDACFLAGGGRVVIPCGIYLTGDIRLRSNVELYLEAGAILKGIFDPEEYSHFLDDKVEPVTVEEIDPKNKMKCASAVATSRWCNGLIRAIDAENIAIVGEKGSYIDGSNVYDPKGEEGYRGPHAISVWRCKNIRFEGYTITNSGNWNHAIFNSQNIHTKNVTVYGGHDGFDVRTCDNVLVEDCKFDTGDDAIAGFDNHDVVVRNCILNSACQSIRFGGNNVLIENCDCNSASFGFRHRLNQKEREMGAMTHAGCRHETTVPFSYYCDFRVILRKPAENMIIRNCHFHQVKELFRLQFDGRHIWCCNRSMKEITFENCTFENIIRCGMAWGQEEEKFTLTYKNCRIKASPDNKGEPLFCAANFDKIRFEDTIIEGYDSPSILVADDGVVEQIGTTKIDVKKETKEACYEAHPWGIIPGMVAPTSAFEQ